MHFKLLAASLALLLADVGAAAAPPPLKATGPWNVEFADSMCLLSRPFGEDRSTILYFKPAMVGKGLEVMVAKLKAFPGPIRSGKAVVATGVSTVVGDAGYFAYGTKSARLLRVSVDGEKLTLQSLRDTLTIDAAKEGRHAFAITGIERALPILSDCVAQLRADYKVGEADLAAIATQPQGSVAGLFTIRDYPSAALGADHSGTVGALFWVEATGQISTCTIVESSSVPSLDQATCDILKRRAKFKPAMDINGKAVRAPSFARIRWLV